MSDCEPAIQKDQTSVVKLGDQLDLNHLEELYKNLKPYYAARDLVLDFSEILDMDTAAIQLLIAFKKSFPASHSLTFKNISPGLENVWEMIGVRKILLK